MSSGHRNVLHDGSYVCLASIQYMMFFDVREAVRMCPPLFGCSCHDVHIICESMDKTNRHTRLRNVDPTDARLCSDTLYCARLACWCTTLTCAKLPDLAVGINIVFYPHSLSIEWVPCISMYCSSYLMNAECDAGGGSSRLFVCVFELLPCVLYIIGFSLVFDRCWDSIVGIAHATGFTVRGWNPGGVKLFSFLRTRSLGPPSSFAVGTGTLLSEVKWSGRGVEVKNE